MNPEEDLCDFNEIFNFIFERKNFLRDIGIYF